MFVSVLFSSQFFFHCYCPFYWVKIIQAATLMHTPHPLSPHHKVPWFLQSFYIPIPWHTMSQLHWEPRAVGLLLSKGRGRRKWKRNLRREFGSVKHGAGRTDSVKRAEYWWSKDKKSQDDWSREERRFCYRLSCHEIEIWGFKLPGRCGRMR